MKRVLPALVGAALLLPIAVSALPAQAESIFEIPLHGVARITLARQHDSLAVETSAPGSPVVYRCERPLTIARQWTDPHAATLLMTPGSAKVPGCGVAIREVRDANTKAVSAHFFEMAMGNALHLAVPLSNEETWALAALLDEATR